MSILEQLLGNAMQGMNRSGDAGAGAGMAPPGAAGASPIMAILLQLLTSGGQGGASQPGAMGGGLGGLLGGLLGGGAAQGRSGAGGDPLAQLAGALLGGGRGGGGLSGMLQQFQQAGLGRQADSWVGTGQNQPVSPDQLAQVFGRERLQGLADQHGIDLNQLLGGLSQQLPSAVDALTPKGAVPAPNDFAQTIGSLLGGRR